MKKVGFYKRESKAFNADVLDAIKERLQEEHDVEMIDGLDYRKAYSINGKAYIKGVCINDLDVFFWHGTVYPRDWAADNYFLNVLEAATPDCVFVNTPQSVRTVNDKYLAHVALARHDLPVAPHALVDVSNKTVLQKIFKAFNNDMVLKPRFGGWGVGIVRVTSLDQLFSTIEFMQTFTQNESEQVFIEQFIPNDIAKWVSVVVIGGEPVYGYRKTITNDEGWKVYDPNKEDGMGALSEYVELSDELKELGAAAAKAIGKDIISFDCIYSTEDQQYYIVDENGRPGLYAHCLEAAGIDMTDMITNLIVAKL